ncbi:D-hexose-6-phosphate mutarotase [Parachitinimonas caeni]|uniref:Putative glucose-6-phosphate 1-epimerase n=1 Tax=Parachitinimonas caeni TaxID=3031301 RepID=A0ABT7DYI0_9NEIS|nr:D-hexose-6-phosphate mutarotase [Parachitinimonas caeni]MDK2125096.1 D-hexose-6-phosphate mutarotase [Parachitinimonas caeni]
MKNASAGLYFLRLPDGVRIEHLPRGQAVVEVETRLCRATLSVQGAQVLKFESRASNTPMLWVSRDALFEPGRAIRGGIPLCWPWFNAHPDNPGLPSHGFARNLDWRLESADILPSGEARVVFCLEDSEQSRQWWPHAFKATLVLTLGLQLQLAFSVSNTGDDAFDMSYALHSYFPVSDLNNVRVEGLDGRCFIDQLQGNARRMQSGPVQIAGETDAIYLDVPDTLILVDGNRMRRVTADNMPCAVVWNPGPHKAARMADLGDDEYAGMLCVERGRLADAAIRLDAGASHRSLLTLADF